MAALQALDPFSLLNAPHASRPGGIGPGGDPACAESTFRQAIERSHAVGLRPGFCLLDASLGLAGARRVREDVDGARVRRQWRHGAGLESGRLFPRTQTWPVSVRSSSTSRTSPPSTRGGCSPSTRRSTKAPPMRRAVRRTTPDDDGLSAEWHRGRRWRSRCPARCCRRWHLPRRPPDR